MLCIAPHEEEKNRRFPIQYCFTKIVKLDFDDALHRVTEELKKEGFGVLTEIDVKETLKKLNVDFNRYRILGACSPNFAYQALREDKIGTMLPCKLSYHWIIKD